MSSLVGCSDKGSPESSSVTATLSLLMWNGRRPQSCAPRDSPADCSWGGLPDPSPLEDPPEGAQHFPEPAVRMESGRESQIPRHLGHGEIVLESELDEQAVTAIEPRQRRFQRRVRIRRTDLGFGAGAARSP